VNLDDLLALQKPRANTTKQPAASQYNVREFQLEVLEKLAETQALARELAESWQKEAAAIKEQGKSTKLDLRTMVAIAAIALSIAGYIVQDARNSSRQDSEIETTKARVTNLERIAATNTEARVRSEVELNELRQGQAEIKQLLLQHESHTSSLLHKP
jgi:hypothetical protein